MDYIPDEKHKLYVTYRGMISRCYHKTCNNYVRYGGKGIQVADRWRGKGGFKNFLADMGEKPTPEHTLDRIDTLGNYSPDNCRWATRHEQARNQKGRTDTMGVSFNSYYGKWRAGMIYKRERVLDELFDNFADAVAARKAAEIKYLGATL